MIKSLIKEKYSLKLVSLMLESSFLGIFVSNLIGPVAAVYVVSDYISAFILFVWLLLHLSLLVLRIYLKHVLHESISQKSAKVAKYFKIVNICIFSTAVLFGYLVWVSVLQNIPSLNIFVLGIIIFSLSAGSISTLGTVFKSFLIFIVFNFLFLISALLYHGGDMFYMFALTMSVMMIILIISGRAYYVNIRNGISLNETIHTIYENSSDGVVIVKDNRFVNSNKAIIDMFKAPSRAVFLHTDVMEFMPARQPDGSNSFRKMAKLMSSAIVKGSVNFEWLHNDYYGNEFWCEVVLTKIHLDGEDLLHGVWRDISERKEIQALDIKHKKEIELLNSNLEAKVKEEVEQNMQKDRQMLHQSRLAQMGEMIAMIAHQWRQPLSAISAASATLNVRAQLKTLDDETVIETSKKIDKFVQHLSSTIDDFRNFFKENKSEKLTNYTKIIDGVLGIIGSVLKSKGIDVILELECQKEFTSYENELKQVLINLVTNSKDALLEGDVKDPFIKISTYTMKDKYILEVSDNGGGIKDEISEKIYDPYFSTKLNKQGTGLGLYMSNIIIQNHCNGKLSFKNIDDGVCFRVELSDA